MEVVSVIDGHDHMQGLEEIIDISIIISYYDVSSLAYRSIRSAAKARKYAESKGLKIETILISNSIDKVVRKDISRYKSQLELAIDSAYFIEHKNMAETINLAISKAKGKYVSVLNGYDIFGETWLYLAYNEVIKNDLFIIHPELIVAFGSKNIWARQIDQESKQFEIETLLTKNYWIGSVLVPINIYKAVAYKSSDISIGSKNIEWIWNCDTIASGYIHKIASNAIQYIRIRKIDNDIYIPDDSDIYNSPKLIKCITKRNDMNITINESKRCIGFNNIQNNGAFTIFVRSIIRQILGNRSISYLRLLCDSWRNALIVTFINPIRILNNKIKREKEGNDRVTNSPLPRCVIQELREISNIEPKLFPSHIFLSNLRYYQIPKPDYAKAISFIKAYSQIINTNYSHIIVIPWLKAGGADLGTIQYARAVHTKLNRKLLVISTENADSPWKDKIIQYADFIELGKIVHNKKGDFKDLVFVLTRILLQKHPKVIHNVNSGACWVAYKTHGRALRKYSKLFASLFADEIDAEGKPVGYAREYLEETYDILELIFSDNSYFPKVWATTYGISSSKFCTAYFPVSNDLIDIGKARLKNDEGHQTKKQKNRILWTGRIAKEKKPEVVAKIAEQMQDIQFDIWGYSENPYYTRLLERQKNIVLKGKYSNFMELPFDDYSAYLYTSESDGMPNTLLEAAAVGLKIVGPRVGGSGDLLNEETAYIVDDLNNIDSFCQKIQEALHDSSQLKAINAHNLVKSRHSFENFLKTLENVEGYIL